MPSGVKYGKTVTMTKRQFRNWWEEQERERRTAAVASIRATLERFSPESRALVLAEVARGEV